MKLKVKSFGEVMMRLEVPDRLKLEQSQLLHVSYTGTGVNVLSALSKFGHDTSLMTKLPHDSIGDAALAHIRSFGISTRDITRGEGYLGKYFLENGFSVRPTKVTYSSRKESSFCTSSLADYDLENVLKDTQMLHLCGITLAISEQTRKIALHVAEKAKQLGVIVVFDCNYRPKLWGNEYEQARECYESMLQLTDICFMTEKDAKYILGLETTEVGKQNQIEHLLPIVAETYQISTIAGTIRKDQVDQDQVLQGFMYHLSSFTYSGDYMYQVYDRIGAGDGFASGIMHSLIQKLPMQDAIEFSTAAGVLAHTTYGDSPLSTAEDVWTLVHNKGGVNIER